ncbi:MAG: hypothetical protein M3R15_09375 [Acidobacteriota bacterium]|nr:hypothetical protein [Acidobacteriota bacterium]
MEAVLVPNTKVTEVEDTPLFNAVDFHVPQGCHPEIFRAIPFDRDGSMIVADGGQVHRTEGHSGDILMKTVLPHGWQSFTGNGFQVVPAGRMQEEWTRAEWKYHPASAPEGEYYCKKLSAMSPEELHSGHYATTTNADEKEFVRVNEEALHKAMTSSWNL